MKREIKITKDGSKTLFVPELNEHYHSVNGAIQESNHVFIEAGLNFIEKKEINILEIGFGTGLNSFLTYLWANQNQLKVKYTSIELYPIDKGLIADLNYYTNDEEKDVFLKIHEVAWEEFQKISDDFELCKLKGDIVEYNFKLGYDLIYFDAFAPEKQPKLWTNDIFKKMHYSLNKGGVLTTYCSKGIVKQAIRDAGFELKRLPGPPGKRHMLRAIKI